MYGTEIGACIVLHKLCLIHKSNALAALSEIVKGKDMKSLDDEMVNHTIDAVATEVQHQCERISPTGATVSRFGAKIHANHT